MTRPEPLSEADAQLVRDASRRVGLSIALAAGLLVIGLLVVVMAIVFSQIPPSQLFSTSGHDPQVDVGGADLIVGGVIGGLCAVLLAGGLALVVTRRAVSPLVDALARQRRFVADASHELRTPLAILDARIQELQRRLPPGDETREALRALRQDSQNLNDVVSDLLATLAGPATERDAVDAVLIAAETVRSMQLLAHERGVSLVLTSGPPNAFVRMPSTSVTRCIVALIDNALKHSPQGGEVSVAVASERRQVTVEVTDHGGGITGISPDRVFDRFARSSEAIDGGGNARTGFGIGLALVREITNQNGGSVVVAATGSGGTTMQLRLPGTPSHS